MDGAELMVTLASTGTLAVALGAATFLRGWREWLELRREVAAKQRPTSGGDPDLAELRRRVRRLEAIADGALLR